MPHDNWLLLDSYEKETFNAFSFSCGQNLVFGVLKCAYLKNQTFWLDTKTMLYSCADEEVIHLISGYLQPKVD